MTPEAPSPILSFSCNSFQSILWNPLLLDYQSRIINKELNFISSFSFLQLVIYPHVKNQKLYFFTYLISTEESQGQGLAPIPSHERRGRVNSQSGKSANWFPESLKGVEENINKIIFKILRRISIK
jgi:hypothetical protein